MKLNDLKPSDKPVWFTLTDVDDEEVVSGSKSVRFALWGPDSDVMVKFARQSEQKKLDHIANKSGRVRLSATDIDKEATEQAVIAVADWEWEGLEIDGKPVTFSSDAVREVVTQVRWIRDWINEKVRNRGNFFGQTASTPKK